MPDLETIELLKQGRKVVDTGWVRMNLMSVNLDGTVGYCAIGALAKAVGATDEELEYALTSDTACSPSIRRGVYALADTVYANGFENPSFDTAYEQVIAFNDRCASSADDVKDLFQQTIDRLENQA